MENASSAPAPAPPCLGAVQPSDQRANNDSAQLSHSLKPLSISTAARTPLPPSPGMYSPRRISDQARTASSPATHKPPPNAPSRSPSAFSIDRTSSPALARKGSTSSLRGSETPTTPHKLAPRRSSSNLVPSSPTTAKAPLAATMEEVPPLTAATVAADYLRRDLSGHGASDASADAIVVIHDSCYGHRYSRPKTNKSTLSMIVERPERIHASILGVSAAYVRLGERHAGGHNAPQPKRDPTGKLPFKIRKTSRSVDITSSVVTNVHGTSWMQELKGMCDSAGSKLASTGKELSRSYENPGQPDQPVKAKLHEGDLYLCPESLDAFQGALGAVCDGVDAVFEGSRTGQGPSRAFVCIRPPGHHCSSDYPSGFCWLNNVHVGIEHAAQAHGLTHAAIIDFDLHHGDGSQAITWEHNSKVINMSKNTPNSKKTAIGYFSLHDINSYPCEDGDIHKVQNASLCIENAHGQSIWNVHLQPWKTEEDFWDLYETRYSVLIDKARTFLRTHTERLRSLHNYPQPKAAIFLSAGFDASEWESQGMQRHKVNVPTEFYARFTRDIMSLAREEGTGVDGRVISTLEGGYSDRALMSGVLSHLSGLCEIKNAATPNQATNESGLGAEMQRRLNNLTLNEGVLANGSSTGIKYDTEWWHSSALTALESLVNPTSVPAPAKKPRNSSGGPSNYFTPTQSFTAKAVDPSKLYRTPSGTVRHSSGTRPPTPPPPEVDWATASHELSKLLIPTDRQTRSCKPEELAEPRVKKERQHVTPTDVPAAGGRQLRDRKAKPANYADLIAEEDTLPVLNLTKGNRRKTIADLPLICDSAGDAIGERRPSHSRRRSSVASIGSVSTVAPSTVVATKAVKGTSTKPTANGVQVKKTRRVSDARPGSSVRDTSTEPPVPPVPAAYASKPRATRQSPRKERPKPNEDNFDMEQLTSGIKRINIKVPSKEEYEARQAQKAVEEAEEKKAAPKPATRKPPASRATKATAGTAAKRVSGKGVKDPALPSEQERPAVASKTPEPAIPVPAEAPELVQNELPGIPPLPQQPVDETPVFAPGEPESAVATAAGPLGSTEHFSIPSSFPLHLPVTDIPAPGTMSSPPSAVSQVLSSTTPQPNPQNSNASNFPQIQYLLNQQSTDSVQEPAQPLQHLAPNTHPVVAHGPPSPPGKQKGQLPFFTANGVIPFGSGATMPASAALPTPGTAHGHENVMPPPNGAAGVVKEDRFKDIWEVPETPDKR